MFYQLYLLPLGVPHIGNACFGPVTAFFSVIIPREIKLVLGRGVEMVTFKQIDAAIELQGLQFKKPKKVFGHHANQVGDCGPSWDIHYHCSQV